MTSTVNGKQLWITWARWRMSTVALTNQVIYLYIASATYTTALAVLFLPRVTLIVLYLFLFTVSLLAIRLPCFNKLELSWLWLLRLDFIIVTGQLSLSSLQVGPVIYCCFSCVGFDCLDYYYHRPTQPFIPPGRPGNILLLWLLPLCWLWLCTLCYCYRPTQPFTPPGSR